jgi:hypothetical protein
MIKILKGSQQLVLSWTDFIYPRDIPTAFLVESLLNVYRRKDSTEAIKMAQNIFDFISRKLSPS